jgi:hypothetical protein
MLKKHVVVDGSNIATEARTTPSLTQLDEAVRAFLAEHPTEQATVIVDATFGHRIHESEQDAFEDAVDAGELLTAPAGTIGRGDAFVLQVANKADATVLSNDSFQEFHGQYPWLFDEGRLMGGKPVPGVGWVFLLRSPVRGPVSRRAVKDARQAKSGRSAGSRKQGAKKAPARAAAKKSGREGPSLKKAAGRKRAATRGSRRGSSRTTTPDDPATTEAVARAAADDGTGARNRARKPLEPLNPPLPFLEFVGAHPVGSTVRGTVDQFSSHGAYVIASGARCYVPLKLMGTPAPKSAKEIFAIGDARDFVVFSIDGPRRGIDLALPGVDTTSNNDADMHADQQEQRKKATSRTRKRGLRSPSRRADNEDDRARPDDDADRALRPKSSKTPTRASALATTTRADQLAEEAPVTPARKKRTAKKAAKRSPARRRKAAAKRPAKKRATKKRATKRTAKKRATKKRATKKRAAKRPAKKRATKKRATKKRATKKRATKKRASKKRAAKRPAKRRATKKRASKKRAAKRPAKKRATKRRARRRR